MSDGTPTKATPGPWTAHTFQCDGGRQEAGAQIDAGERPIGVVWGHDGLSYSPAAGFYESLANAHLIAAAPDMYDALDDALGLLVQIQQGLDVRGIVDGNIRQILAVRAKARGEQ
ncbi:MAG: hypothetical protein M3Y58_12310 [Chloroflexota bacterium]|nr:hypothetical protein [Chloroflexota bacterium]